MCWVFQERSWLKIGKHWLLRVLLFVRHKPVPHLRGIFFFKQFYYLLIRGRGELCLDWIHLQYTEFSVALLSGGFLECWLSFAWSPEAVSPFVSISHRVSVKVHHLIQLSTTDLEFDKSQLNTSTKANSSNWSFRAEVYDKEFIKEHMITESAPYHLAPFLKTIKAPF